MAQVYLAMFVIGFILTLLSFLTGAAGHGHGGHLHLPHVGHGADGGGEGGVPVLNFGTITAFLMWFGGVGFLLTAYSGIVTVVVVGLALLAGVAGAAVVFVFVSKVLVRDQLPMNPADYHLPGTLGRVTVRIPVGGTGEMVYTQGGSRKTAAARDAGGQEIGRGTEVVVLRYERGVAFVRPWDQLGPDHVSERRDGPTVRPEERPR
jgi:membrane protein implicated in regulation of membrane protease activity